MILLKEKMGAANIKHINYRLIQEFEVPEWVKTKPEEPCKINLDECGQGKRERKKVNYNDELTESQWAKIIDQGGDLNVRSELNSYRKKLKKSKKGRT
jgi:hypothetical protein